MKVEEGMKVSVTDWHIKTGCKASYTSCPVANAITPLLPAGQYAFVYHDAFYVKGGKDPGTRITFPGVVADWIRDYDAGHGGEPFEFELDYRIQ